MDTVTTAIGLIAALGTTLAFLPQTLKSWRTKAVNDLSLGMIVLFAGGVALWIVYGVLREDIVVIIANVATLFLVSTLLVLKLLHHGR